MGAGHEHNTFVPMAAIETSVAAAFVQHAVQEQLVDLPYGTLQLKRIDCKPLLATHIALPTPDLIIAARSFVHRLPCRLNCHNHYLTQHLLKHRVHDAVSDEPLSQGKLQNVFTPVMETDSFCLHFDSTLPVCGEPFRTYRYLSQISSHITALTARHQEATIPFCCSLADLECVLTHPCVKLPQGWSRSVVLVWQMQ